MTIDVKKLSRLDIYQAIDGYRRQQRQAEEEYAYLQAQEHGARIDTLLDELLERRRISG